MATLLFWASAPDQVGRVDPPAYLTVKTVPIGNLALYMVSTRKGILFSVPPAELQEAALSTTSGLETAYAGAVALIRMAGAAHAAPFARVRRETADPAPSLASDAGLGEWRGEVGILQSKT